MCHNLKYEVSGCFHDVRVALQHSGAPPPPPPPRDDGLVCSVARDFYSVLIALEEVVGGRSKESFIDRETETG